MSVFTRWAEALRQWLGSGDKALAALFGGGTTAAGIGVNETTALNISAVWCAINVIAGAVSSLPLVLYKRLADDGKERFTTHRLYRLLHDEPNPETTSAVFRLTLQAHALTWGNGYAEIQFDETGAPAALWQITPDRVTPTRDARGALVYRVVEDDGNQVVLSADRMLHVPGLGWDGTQGYSVIYKARESLGLLLAAERFGSTFFGNGATPGLTAHHPGKLSEAAHQRLKSSLTNALQGPGRAHNLILLEEGVTIEKVGIPPNDAQFLETRKLQVTEVARWFNIPPHMLKDLDRATFSNIEQQSLEFVIHTLTPWLVRWEQELERKLIRPMERRQQFIKHNVNALLRGDTASRFTAYATGRQWGWLSANDILKLEDQNPIGTQGDTYLLPLNMIPANTIPSTAERVDALGGLIRAGFDPAASLKAMGLPAIDHSGAPPVTVQPKDDYPGAAQRGGGGAVNGGGGPPADQPTATGPDADRMRQIVALIVEQLRPTLQEARIVEMTEIAHAAVEETMKALPPPMADPEALGERLDVMETSARVAAAELAARLDAAETAHQAQAARTASLAPKLRDVIEGALRKEVRFEADRARKAAQTPEKFRAWLDAFYATREETMLTFVLPAMRLHFVLTDRADEADDESRRLIAAYVAHSRAELGAVLEQSATLDADVKALVTRWETERPAAMADALMQEVIAHAA